MKKFILFLLVCLPLLAQTNDSLKVDWVDPIDSDLDSVRLYYDSYYDPQGWTWFQSVNEGVGTWEGVAPDTGYPLMVTVAGIDDSGNVCIDSVATSDTVSIWASSAYTTYTAGATYTWLWTDANNPVDTVLDNTAGLQVSMPVSDNQLAYTDTGLTADGNDYMRNVSTPSSLFTSGITIECVVYIASATAKQIIYGLRDSAPYNIGFGINTNTLIGSFYNGSDDLTYNCSITAGWHHIVVTWDNTTTFAVYIDGSAVADAGDSYQYGGLIASARIALGSDGGGASNPADGTTYTYWAIYANDILNATEVSNNYGSEIIQTSIPEWAR